jgi:rhamnosyltransferase subunit B
MTEMPLRILVAGFGATGDVQPLVPICDALRGRGHDVSLILPAVYRRFAERAGCEFVELCTEAEFEDFASQSNLWRPVRGLGPLASGIASVIEPTYRAIAERFEPDRTLLVLSSLAFGGRIAQDKLNVPAVTVHPYPAIFRSEIRPPAIPPLPVSPRYPRWRNRLWYGILDTLILDPLLARPVNAVRAKYGLPPIRRLFDAWIHSPDRVIGLFPDWFAPPAPDWPRQTVLTGFPMYDQADLVPLEPELARYLDEGDAPILFTSGSIIRGARKFFDLAIAVCQKRNRRGLLVSPHPADFPANPPPGIAQAGYTPFSRVLSKCAAIVHHGGIGTIALALAAGIPQVAVTRAFDQDENAGGIERLGVGVKLPARRLDQRTLTAALDRALDFEHSAASAAIKRRFVGANPLADTTRWIERTFAEAAARPARRGAATTRESAT